MTPTYDPDAIGQMIDDAPEAGFINVNFGAVTVKPQVLRWVGEKDSRTPERVDMPKGYKLQPGETLELVFTQDIREFNEQLSFDYERTIAVKKSSPREKTDWTEIVERSLIEVFGKDWVKVLLGGKRVYCAIEDAPNIAGRASKAGKVYGVPKFLQTFKNAAECKAARDARYSGKSAAGAGEIPAAVVGQVQSLLASMGNDDASVLKVLAGKPFGDFDPQKLLDAAKA